MEKFTITLLIDDQVGISDAQLARLSGSFDIKRFSDCKGLDLNRLNAVVVTTEVNFNQLINLTTAIRALFVVWKSDNGRVSRTLLDHDQLAGIIDGSCTDDVIVASLGAATRQLSLLGKHRAAQMLEDVLEIGRALASEKDLDKLLGLILSSARKLTGADGSSIYTLDANSQLYFRLWQNESTGATANAQRTLVGDYSIAGYVSRSGEMVVIDNVYKIPDDAPYKFNPASDKSIGYHTQSLLTVPLKDKSDAVVGVLQLINRKNNAGAILKTEEDCRQYVVPFEQRNCLLAEALAGQAGIALENSILYADIEKLFEGFIKASVSAIESRDPTTAGHSFRVAEFTERLAKAVDHNQDKDLRSISFDAENLREIRYAALLHDFGKVGVREEVLLKAKKLYPGVLDNIHLRFKYARSLIQHHAYLEIVNSIKQSDLTKQQIADRTVQVDKDLKQRLDHLEHLLQIVNRANEPSVSFNEVSDDLNALSGFTFPAEDDEEILLINDFEFADLNLAKGSLNPDERKEIESHVSHTFAFLSLIPWTKSLSALPNIAYAHHEFLDGSGYPRGLKQDQIPIQSKIMTIADIYDALTARDRPYKRSIPVERALDILSDEAERGKVDSQLLKVFIDSHSYELLKTVPKL